MRCLFCNETYHFTMQYLPGIISKDVCAYFQLFALPQDLYYIHIYVEITTATTVGGCSLLCKVAVALCM